MSSELNEEALEAAAKAIIREGWSIDEKMSRYCAKDAIKAYLAALPSKDTAPSVFKTPTEEEAAAIIAEGPQGLMRWAGSFEGGVCVSDEDTAPSALREALDDNQAFLLERANPDASISIEAPNGSMRAKTDITVAQLQAALATPEAAEVKDVDPTDMLGRLAIYRGSWERDDALEARDPLEEAKFLRELESFVWPLVCEKAALSAPSVWRDRLDQAKGQILARVQDLSAASSMGGKLPLNYDDVAGIVCDELDPLIKPLPPAPEGGR